MTDGIPPEEFADDLGDGGGLNKEQPVDQFFAPGDDNDPENAAGEDPTDDAVFVDRTLDTDDDVNTGKDDDVAISVARQHSLRVRHEAEHRAAVTCTTTAGPISMVFHRSWSPNGYDRATSLFERGYYDHSHFFRVVPHFLVQFGISYTGDAELKYFADSTIGDDPKREDLMPFREGMLSFAGSGPNSRNSQLFIAYDRAGGLGNSPWETPFGEVVEGMENVRNLCSGYGDMPPWGKGPQQGPIRNQGSSYIEENFSLLDKFETCTVKRLESLHNRQEVIGDQHAVPDTRENVKAIRGGEVKARPIKKASVGSFHTENNGGDLVAEKQSLLMGRIIIAAIIITALGIVNQLIIRGKRNKRMGKSV